MVEFFTAIQSMFYYIFIASVVMGLALVPCWLVGAIGILCKSRLAHVWPLTILAWIGLSLYTGIEYWLSRGT